jgi:hypothetical protein
VLGDGFVFMYFFGGFGGEQHDEVKYRGDHFEGESFK